MSYIVHSVFDIIEHILALLESFEVPYESIKLPNTGNIAYHDLIVNNDIKK